MSDQGEFHVVAGAVVLNDDLDDVQSVLLDIKARLGCPVHSNDLSRADRVDVVEAIMEIDSWDGYLFETASQLEAGQHSERHVRAKTLFGQVQIRPMTSSKARNRSSNS